MVVCLLKGQLTLVDGTEQEVTFTKPWQDWWSRHRYPLQYRSQQVAGFPSPKVKWPSSPLRVEWVSERGAIFVAKHRMDRS